jgi:hypothetical protein
MWPIYLFVSAAALAYAAWGFSKGKIRAKGRSYYRAEEPKLFWACLGIYVVFGIAFALIPVCYRP